LRGFLPKQNGAYRNISGAREWPPGTDTGTLPFNITTEGATTIQGTAPCPTINGAFISRNAGVVSIHTNGVTLNGVFGTGTYPPIHRRTSSRSRQWPIHGRYNSLLRVS